MSKEMKQKAVNIKRSAYALASTDGENATLTMYGDIYETRPIDWWTDEPIEGDFILLDEFLRDLDEIQRCRSLTIRMNSYGGDANVANVIHNRLRELSRDGMDIRCVVDGVAMSGGSLIMCAADNVEVNPSSLIMIHNAWSFFFGGYNSADLLEAAKTARVNAYFLATRMTQEGTKVDGTFAGYLIGKNLATTLTDKTIGEDETTAQKYTGIKINWMKSAINQRSDYDMGILDVSFTTWPDRVGYTPFSD